MKFFKPEDFSNYGAGDPRANIFENIAGLANDKLEREGRVVYGKNKLSLGTQCWDAEATFDTHKALLINIEPIQIIPCKHPKEKVHVLITEGYERSYGAELPVYQSESYKCECGAEVKPKEFEEL